MSNNEKGQVTKPKPEDEVKALNEKITSLEGELARSKQQVEFLQVGTPIKSYQAEIERLKKDYDSINEKWTAKEAEEHAAKIRHLVDLRVKAGFCEDKDRVTEAKKFESLQAEAIEAMTTDFELLATEAISGGSKAKYLGSKKDSTLYDSVSHKLFGASAVKQE